MGATLTGHHENRFAVDQDGDAHLNGAAIYNAAGTDISGALENLDPANLVLDSTNEINVTIGGVGLLAIDDSAITGHAAAADTAGQDAFIETQDGGADGGTGSTGQAGGSLSFKSGDGSDAATTNAVGGAGGSVTIASGAGGNGDGTGNGGAGGDVVLTPAVNGTGGTPGADGHVKFGAAHSKAAAATGNPAFGTGTGFTGAGDIANVAAWFLLKDAAGDIFYIPAWQ